MATLKHIVDGDGQHYGYRFQCPGCNGPHVITTEPYKGGWGFNGDEARPTFSPSILVHPSKHLVDGQVVDTPRCHSFVESGRIRFLSDSTHALAGQTVDLPAIDE